MTLKLQKTTLAMSTERKYITFNKLVKKKKKMDVNEHEKLFNITLIDIKFCISVMVGSSTMSKTRTLK